MATKISKSYDHHGRENLLVRLIEYKSDHVAWGRIKILLTYDLHTPLEDCGVLPQYNSTYRHELLSSDISISVNRGGELKLGKSRRASNSNGQYRTAHEFKENFLRMLHVHYNVPFYDASHIITTINQAITELTGEEILYTPQYPFGVNSREYNKNSKFNFKTELKKHKFSTPTKEVKEKSSLFKIIKEVFSDTIGSSVKLFTPIILWWLFYLMIMKAG
jgi:hypothetical protein